MTPKVAGGPMDGTSNKRTVRGAIVLCALGWALAGCGSADKPFSLVGDAPPSAPPGDGAAPGGPVDGCFVNFKSLIQLKISANPAGEPLEVLDSNPVDIPPIPIRVDGSQLTMAGDTFPEFILDRLSSQADLRIKGIPGVQAVGSYNAETGEMKLDDFKFSLEILSKGTTDPFLPGSATIDGVNFTTGSVTASGNLHSISETGAPVNKDSRSMTLVVGLTLPGSFSPLSVLDSMIGGGALTARFEGVLDLTPENCGGTPAELPGDGVAQPPGLKVSVQSQTSISQIDFGTSAVLLKADKGKKVIDCLEAGNRQIVSRILTIANTDAEPKVIQFAQPQDSDYDVKSPLCGGTSEFVRGTISVSNGGTCETIQVGGRDFMVGKCTLPPGATVSFPLMYLPFNYLDPGPDGEGRPHVHDEGFFAFDYGGTSPFRIKLKGGTVPDFRDVFSVSKVNLGTESLKEIRNKGTLKLQLDAADPLTQALVLKNSGTDDWENISFTFEKGTVFSAQPPTENRLPAATEADPGRMAWGLKFTPQGAAVNNDTLTIRMIQKGSVTPETPQGVEVKIVLNLLGTVGVPRLNGEIQLQFDYLVALIDHSALDAPTESVDYRDFQEIKPEPVRLVFSDTEHEDIKEVELDASVVDIMDPNLSVRNREKVLRVFTSRASIGKNGERLASGDNSDKCFEAASLLVPYRPGDCSYFYHNILSSGTGIYDDETGHMTIPDIALSMENPYHADIIGKWPASNPNANPDYVMRSVLNMSFTTHILDRAQIEEGGRTLSLLPDERISASELVLKSKPLGAECPQGIFEGADPNFRCFLSTGDRYLEGKAVTLRPNQVREYDVVLVGVGQFASLTQDPELPWFLGEDGGTRIFIAILGRMYKAEP